MKRNILKILIFILVIFLFYIARNEKKSPSENYQESQIVSCTRTTRLENLSQYDRALSLIEEKYISWEKGDMWQEWYFFPSQLVNCIKIVEDETRKDSEIEGYFIFNGEEIKDNYFPIVVDKDYSDVDDILTALILVHEITHVQQYLDTINGIDSLSCIDKEVQTFSAQLKYYGFQNDETRKSMDYRLEHDDELHPQLKLIKSISQSGVIPSIYSTGCMDESAEPDCLKNIELNRIKEILLQDDYYVRQCKV